MPKGESHDRGGAPLRFAPPEARKMAHMQKQSLGPPVKTKIKHLKTPKWRFNGYSQQENHFNSLNPFDPCHGSFVVAPHPGASPTFLMLRRTGKPRHRGIPVQQLALPKVRSRLRQHEPGM